MRLVTDVFEFGARELPKWNTISISGYHMREAGATAAQELAFTLADAIAYVDAALARGVAIDDFAPRLSFFFAAWSELFEEVAKFRAARRMWARIVRERFGSSNARSMACRFHVQTAGSSLTAQSVDNNVVRTTIQALSAILGGAQSPGPLGGSSFVETLTSELERAAQGYLDEIDAMGGTMRALEAGFQQRSIQESGYRVQRAIDDGDQVVVGVNRFRDEAPAAPHAIQRIDPEAERRQVAGVRRVRAERD